MTDRTIARYLDHSRVLREKTLLAEASRLLLAAGCRDFRIDAVATASGVAKGTCYKHFGSQQRLINLAARQADEVLASRLSSPPARLRGSSGAIRWALLEAVDAQVRTLELRSMLDGVGPNREDVPTGLYWPCCLDRACCPHGGAAASVGAIQACADGWESSQRRAASQYMPAVLGLPSGHLRLGKFRPSEVRGTASALLRAFGI